MKETVTGKEINIILMTIARMISNVQACYFHFRLLRRILKEVDVAVDMLIGAGLVWRLVRRILVVSVKVGVVDDAEVGVVVSGCLVCWLV